MATMDETDRTTRRRCALVDDDDERNDERQGVCEATRNGDVAVITSPSVVHFITTRSVGYV